MLGGQDSVLVFWEFVGVVDPITLIATEGQLDTVVLSNDLLARD
ncbi:MAG: hypothetical protein V3V44_03605 [Anaerolineales bacterium]